MTAPKAVPGGPRQHYEQLVDEGRLQPDAHQRRLLAIFQELHDRLRATPPRLVDRLKKRHRPVRGLYLHGSVGRGKTMLMDLFTESLDTAGIPAWRIHFHRFMDETHEQIKAHGNQREPLTAVAAVVAQRARVLCFDEFHVSDIGDAMILAGLLKQLFERGVTLVATSNTAPSELYAGGLQRERFLPAIAAIEHHCRVETLDGNDDFRLRELIRHPVYHHPADERAETELAEEFHALAAGEQITDVPLEIRGHTIQPLHRAGSVVWFDFATLCEGPRAASDYIELARRFGTLIVSGIPQMAEDDNNAARRFIHLVDECYDRAVKLIVSAEVGPTELYTGQRLAAPFERTSSRLIEMQSREYLELAHRP
jgi:cell division protein ZapE